MAEAFVAPMGPASCDEGVTNGSAITTAPDMFLQHVTGQVNKGDVYQMVSAQQHMLMRFEKTNEMLLNFNILSKARYETTQHEFRKHTQLLSDMKIDLDNVFKRIRNLKTTLSKNYPTAFRACSDVYNLVEDDEEEDDTDGDQARGSDSPRLSRQITVIAASSHPVPSTDSQTSSDPEPPQNSQSSESDTQQSLPQDAKSLGLRRV